MSYGWQEIAQARRRYSAAIDFIALVDNTPRLLVSRTGRDAVADNEDDASSEDEHSSESDFDDMSRDIRSHY